MVRETHARSVAKALSWRVMGTLATTMLVFVFTRRLTISLAVGGLEFFSKIVLFWLHERLWTAVPFGRQRTPAVVVWLTGLSGAGKSTVSASLAAALRDRGIAVEQLDGDSIRDIFPNTGFTRPERDAHIRRVGFLASKLEQHGVVVVVSLVSPYRDSREFVRALCGNFVEVHLATPLEECERRDVKGLYAKARRGEIRHFTGIDDPYEPPLAPELAVDTTGIGVEDVRDRILACLRGRGIPL
jgi:adenylylsulfate kinase